MKQIDFSQLALVNGRTDQSAASIPPTLATLKLTSRRATTHHLRDGEVVLYMRPDSGVWQVRYKLLDRRWHCITTRQRQLESARRVAGEIYDRARFRELEGLPQQTKRFDAIANLCIEALEREIEQGIRPQTNRDYIRAISSVPTFFRRERAAEAQILNFCRARVA